MIIWNNISLKNIRPLTTPYLGPSIKVSNFNRIKKKVKNKKIQIYNKFSNKFIVSELMKGKIIGRCVDKAEFGQRSLGNRSILASPLVNNINELTFCPVFFY